MHYSEFNEKLLIVPPKLLLKDGDYVIFGDKHSRYLVHSNCHYAENDFWRIDLSTYDDNLQWEGAGDNLFIHYLNARDTVHYIVRDDRIIYNAEMYKKKLSKANKYIK